MSKHRKQQKQEEEKTKNRSKMSMTLMGKQQRVYSVQMCVGVWMIIVLQVCVCVCVNRVCGTMSAHVFCCRISYTYSVNSHYSLCTESLLVISFSGSLPLSTFPSPVRGQLSMTAWFTLKYLNFQSRNKQSGCIMRDSIFEAKNPIQSHISRMDSGVNVYE